MNQSSEVVVLLGAGAIGLEIVRRLATKKSCSWEISVKTTWILLRPILKMQDLQ